MACLTSNRLLIDGNSPLSATSQSSLFSRRAHPYQTSIPRRSLLARKTTRQATIQESRQTHLSDSMSFGFGISDFVTVPQLAWQVYSSLKDAPEEHKALLEDVRSLHGVLVQVENKVEKQRDSLAAPEWTQLQDIAKRCKEALEDVRSMLGKYQMAGRGKAWGRIKFAGKDTTSVRTRITVQVDRLNTFNGCLLLSAQNRTERKIDKIIANLKRRGSVVSVETVAHVMDKDRGWKLFGRALEEQGITLQMVQERHQSFVGLLADAVSRANTQGNTTNSEGSPTEDDVISVVEANLESTEDPVAEVEQDLTKFTPYALDTLNKTLAYEVGKTTTSAKSSDGKISPKVSQQRKSISTMLPGSSAKDHERFSEAQRRGCLRLGASICRIAKSPRIGASTRESALSDMKTLYNPPQYKNLTKLLRAVYRGEDETVSRLELIASMDSAETHGQMMASRFASLFGRPEMLIILLSNDPSDIQTPTGVTFTTDFEDILCKDVDGSMRHRQQWPSSASPSDPLNAASCVLEFWHDQGLCDIVQTAFPKHRGPFCRNNTGSKSQRRIANDADNQTQLLQTPDICNHCSSLLKPIVAAVVEEKDLDDDEALPDELFQSSDPAAVKMVLDVYTRLFLKELLGHGSNILRDREMRKNARELGIM